MIRLLIRSIGSYLQSKDAIRKSAHVAIQVLHEYETSNNEVLEPNIIVVLHS